MYILKIIALLLIKKYIYLTTMNILVVNGSNKPLKKNLTDFLITRSEFSSVVVLERKRILNIDKKGILSTNVNSKLKIHEVAFLNKTQISLLVDNLFSSYRTFSHILFIDEDMNDDQVDFPYFNIENFRSYFVNELMTKVNFFQTLLEKCKNESLEPSLIVLVPEYAQTKLIKDNITQSILFSSLHMLTTAIADEFIDYNIPCNGVLNDDTVVDTLEWMIFQNKDDLHSKLLANKQIIDW